MHSLNTMSLNPLGALGNKHDDSNNFPKQHHERLETIYCRIYSN